jgi:two-component system NarL family response regulator
MTGDPLPGQGQDWAGSIQVLVVDDHALFRRGLHLVLDAEPDVDVIGAAADAVAAVRMTTELAPDVVLMDIRMPGGDGIAACRAIREHSPTARVVMLTVSGDETDLYEAIRAGASGYLLKGIPLNEVTAAIRAVHGGRSLLGPALARRLLADFGQSEPVLVLDVAAEGPEPGGSGLGGSGLGGSGLGGSGLGGSGLGGSGLGGLRLSPQEASVLELLACGMSDREAGATLSLSENTVKNHVRNVLERLRVHARGTGRSREVV